MLDQTRSIVETFFARIEPMKDVYKQDSFAYFAVKKENRFFLVQGTLFLNVKEPSIPIDSFVSENVRAGHFYLSETGITREVLVERLLSGQIETPNGPLEFASSISGYGAAFQPFHELGLSTQSRITHLTIFGEQSFHHLGNTAELDWELRASPTPYDGLRDLLNEYEPGVLTNVSKVELAAFSPALIDLSSSVEGERATLNVSVAASAARESLSVGIRILEKGKIVSRRIIDASRLTWQFHDAFHIGTLDIPVPKAAVVHAIAIYNGVAQQHYYFGDPKSFQNPRRSIYEAFDPQLALMTDIFLKAQVQREQRNFEAMVGWLFWMLGFAPISIGQTPRSSDAPDIIMCTPEGHIAVVECTVGLLKEDHKLPTLHDRTQAVLRKLSESNWNAIRVLPIIVTAKSIEDIRPELQSAKSQGAYVIAREALVSLVQRTLLPMGADQFYSDAEVEVSAKNEQRGL